MKVCDGVTDCADSSDEKDCAEHVCQTNQFKCPAHGNTSTAFCISKSKVCNQITDCHGNEDELNCPKEEKCKDKFACKNGKW